MCCRAAEAAARVALEHQRAGSWLAGRPTARPRKRRANSRDTLCSCPGGTLAATQSRPDRAGPGTSSGGRDATPTPSRIDQAGRLRPGDQPGRHPAGHEPGARRQPGHPIGAHDVADQAPGGDLPGERLLRPLLRDLPGRHQHERPGVHRQGRHARCQRPQRHAPDGESERRQSSPLRPLERQRRDHLRPGPQLQRRAEGVRQRGDGQVRRHPRQCHRQVARGRDLRARRRHELLRRQQRDRPLELRPAASR